MEIYPLYINTIYGYKNCEIEFWIIERLDNLDFLLIIQLNIKYDAINEESYKKKFPKLSD
jgi:hypothetical protein